MSYTRDSHNTTDNTEDNTNKGDLVLGTNTNDQNKKDDGVEGVPDDDLFEKICFHPDVTNFPQRLNVILSENSSGILIHEQ